MAAILGDLIQIVDYQTYLGQQVLNVYYYRITNITGLSDAGYDDFLAWFETEVVTPIVAIQNAGLVHDYLELRNLSNGVDIRTLTLGTPGGDGTATSALPSYVSVGYKLVRESLVTRNGYKRIAGLNEIHVSGNTWTLAGGPNDLAIAAALAADWVFGVVNTAEPVIVKRPITIPAGTTYLYSSIGSAQFTQLGTQNTRKAGRGD